MGSIVEPIIKNPGGVVNTTNPPSLGNQTTATQSIGSPILLNDGTALDGPKVFWDPSNNGFSVQSGGYRGLPLSNVSYGKGTPQYDFYMKAYGDKLDPGLVKGPEPAANQSYYVPTQYTNPARSFSPLQGMFGMYNPYALGMYTSPFSYYNRGYSPYSYSYSPFNYSSYSPFRGLFSRYY